MSDQDQAVDPTGSATLSMAIVALAAKVSKSDGVSAQIEQDAFERIFKVEPQDLQSVRRLYGLAKRDVAGFTSYADQIAGILVNHPAMLGDIFDGLVAVAAADGVLHPKETDLLVEVAARFGFGPREYAAILARHIRDADSAYAMLGLEVGVSDDELRRRHRQLSRELHPDALTAQGVPTMYQKLAEQRLAKINAAYDVILRERGLKERI